MDVTLEKISEDGTLRQIEVRLDRSLDDPKVWLLAWDGERLRRLSPPELGESATIEVADPEP